MGKVVLPLVFLLAGVGCGGDPEPTAHVLGQLWSDTNGDGVRDPDEPPLAGVTIFINLDLDGSIGAGEPVTKTDDDGRYDLLVPGAGTYDVRPILPFGHRFSSLSAKPRPSAAHIIGGNDAFAGDYGFMASLLFRFDGFSFPFCGGALITDRHVVTAAHCSVGTAVEDVAISVGTLDPMVGGQLIDVERIQRDVAYDFDASHGHDIAVWSLAQPIDLEASGLHTVEMLTADSAALEPGTLATTIGWGVSDRDSPLLQQVHVPLVSNEDCAAVYPESTRFETQICAGAVEGGIDSCQGDSGGPLLVRDEVREVWLHAGITSYGTGCALPDTPGVYARVSALSEVARRMALEFADPITVTVETNGTATADFPARVTTRPQVGAIAPRWQVTGSTLPDAVEPDDPLTVRWSILADSPLSKFTCQYVPDVMAAAAPQDVACGVGETSLSLPGYPTGIFATDLTVSRADVTFTRRANVVAGLPTTLDLQGALVATDFLDPDLPFANFHIDYFDISAVSNTKMFAIDLASSEFAASLTLYDLDQRDFVNGGGILATGVRATNGKQRIIVIPEPGRDYLVGVSSFDPDKVGAYTVSILNDGTLTVH